MSTSKHTVLTTCISSTPTTYLPATAMSPSLPEHCPVGGPPPSEPGSGHARVIEVRQSPAPRVPSAVPSPATDVYLLAALTVSN